MKKMRKLLPAFAMLLVSAIMMSTASFAWFTMNESVTASGMSIQAKATGSLVISDAPLLYNNDVPSVELEGAAELKPITWDTSAWKVADGDTVDIHTGKTTAALKSVENLTDSAVKAQYFIDRDIYIASAGDELTHQNLEVNMSAIATSAKNIYNAYAVAIYVVGTEGTYWANDAYVPVTEEPQAIVYVDSADERNVKVLRGAANGDGTYAGYTIPSIVGVTSGGVGLKVVLRFFVDGALNVVDTDGTPLTKMVPAVAYEAESTGKFVSGTAYFKQQSTQVDGETVVSYVPVTAVDITGLADGGDISTKGWYVLDADYTEPAEYNYVNTDNVPMTGSTLKVTFTADAEPQTPAP